MVLNETVFEEILLFFQQHHPHREGMVVYHFDRSGVVVGWRLIATGSETGGCFNLRTFFRESLLIDTPFLLLIHNHPGGILRPSQKDMVLTGKIRRGLSSLGITLLDHLIVANSQIYSIFQHKIIFSQKYP